MMKNSPHDTDPPIRWAPVSRWLVCTLTLFLLAGCSGGGDPAPKSNEQASAATNTNSQQAGAADQEARQNGSVGGFVLNKDQFRDDLQEQGGNDPPDVDPPPETIHRPVLADPSQTDEVLNRYGYFKYSSKHLLLITDIEPEIAKRLVTYADQENAAWEKYFGPLPPARDGSPFRMVGFLMRDMQPIVELGLIPNQYQGMRTGGHVQSYFWMLDQETDYYRRHLMFHEATHCYMTIMPDTVLPKWYLEGMAELFGTHRMDENGQLTFRVMPEDREHYAGWGRIKTIQEEVADGRMKTIDQIRAIKRIDPVSEVRDYAWSWALCYFLDAHPYYQERFRSLQKQWRTNQFTVQFDRLFEKDMDHMRLEWQLFIADLAEGYDVPRAAIEFAEAKPVSGEQQVEIAAGRGWQGSGWQVEAGRKYRISASGEVTLDDRPKPWVSEPQGITLRYADGLPIGRLTGMLISSEIVEGVQKFDLGRRTTWTAPHSGALYLRVNDAWDDLANDAGRYRVTIDVAGAQ